MSSFAWLLYVTPLADSSVEGGASFFHMKLLNLQHLMKNCLDESEKHNGSLINLQLIKNFFHLTRELSSSSVHMYIFC